jgi:hypothetical protein
VGCDSFLRRDRGGARLIDNRVERDRNRLPGADRGFLAVDPESPLLDNASFQPIPFQEIGLHGDMFRRELPRELIDSMRAGR